MIAALPAGPAYLTGEPVEDVVKPPPCVAEAVIEQHEEAATAAFTGVIAICVAALTARCFLRCGTEACRQPDGVIRNMPQATSCGARL